MSNQVGGHGGRKEKEKAVEDDFLTENDVQGYK